MKSARDGAKANRNYLTAVLAKHAIEQYIKTRSAEPEHTSLFGYSGFFGMSRQPGRAEKLHASNQLLNLIESYLLKKEYPQTSLYTFLIQNAHQLSTEELKEGRLRQICIAILGEADYCLLLGGRTQPARYNHRHNY